MGRGSPKPGQSLAERCSDVAAEWHPTRNGSLRAVDLAAGSHTKVWWLCSSCGNEWRMAPKVRAAPPFSGCPSCSYKRAGDILRTPYPGESLAERHPQVAAEWHPTKNGELQPDEVSQASATKAWWLCSDPDCGHEWQTAVGNRTSGKRSGCPKCSRRRRNLPEAGQSLADLHPDLVAEWHSSKNGGTSPSLFKPGSGTKVWWQCRVCGHEWQATIASRAVQGSGCKPCSYKVRIALRDKPKPGHSFVELHPDIAAQWCVERNGGVRPEGLKPGSDRLVWWRCPDRGHEWQARVYTRTGKDKTGCPECRDLPKPGQSFGERFPEVAAQWHPTKNGDRTPQDFKHASKFMAWWKCPAQGHIWQAPILYRRNAGPTSCPKCTLWGTSEQEIRLAYELQAAGCPVDHDHPPIPVVGRVPVRADIVMPDYRLIVEYDGSYYHHLPDAIRKDTKQSQALIGAGWTVVRIRHHPLTMINPSDVVVAAGASTKKMAVAVLEKLVELGYQPAHSERYCEVPELWAVAEADACITRHHEGSLSALHPAVATQWHPTKNGSADPAFTNPASKVAVWWQCEVCDHEWRTTPKHRTSDGSGCPVCARRKLRRPGRSLGDLRPDLVAKFHPTKNGELSLFDLNPRVTNVAIWWLCGDCGHEWQTKDPRRAGCRPCAAKRRIAEIVTPEPGRSLADLRPDLARQWHPTKNTDRLPTDVTPRSSKPVWWLCDQCGNEWKRSPGIRVSKGSGCRKCSSKIVARRRMQSSAEDSLAATHPHLLKEWHPTKNVDIDPATIGEGSAHRVYWLCSTCGNEWQAMVWTRAKKGFGCKRCASRAMSAARCAVREGNSLAELHPDLAAQWHPDRNGAATPATINASTHTRFWWQCASCGHEWSAKPGNRIRSTYLCPSCKQKRA
ncbi:zinc-ribbon domain-containing protein [Nocardia sp. NPDC051990]|uniref:zinc-ribbon domain-containing protein n=1 Tax=Nocardia sp. NPDC051990 TaxID=3155285 RepID=UPI00342F6661